jgi:predicted nucleotidyltransferase
MASKVAQDALNHLIADLHATHGDNLASVVLYGSAAAGDHVEGSSDYNLLIALNRIAPEDLRLAQAPMREWRRLGHPVPVYFTVEELNDASDVFPIEFLQMEKSRVVLYGRDPFEFVEVSEANLRHQTEYELRSKLIRLRRHYIPASVSVEKLVALMSDSLASFAALFRAVLVLHGQDGPARKADSIRAIVGLLDLDAAPFEQILALQPKGEQQLSERQANDLCGAYMAAIDRVIEVVDKMENRPSTEEAGSVGKSLHYPASDKGAADIGQEE